MKRLFSKKDTEWKPQAHDLVRQVGEALRPIVDEWQAKGYSVREISHIMVLEATSIEIERAVTKRFETEAREKKKRQEEGSK